MNFSIEKKGYSIEEVDAFVEDILGKHQRLQAQNAELEQKLATAKRLIRRFSDTENALKQNIADSKRAAAYMISDAKDRSALLLDSARESCGEIISDLDLKIAQRMDTVSLMKAEVAAFKEQLFSLYSSHIEMIDTLAQTSEDFEYTPDYAPVADAVDAFEAAGEPDCAVPAFVEYPEESIFAEMEEEAPVIQNDEFVLDEAFEPVEEEGAEELVFEAVEEVEAAEEDFGQLAFEDAEEVIPEEEIAFDFSAEENEEPEVTEETDDEDAYEEFSAEAEEDSDDDVVCEVTKEEFEEIDDTDYFKFLNDFINSDDGNN